MRAQEERMKWIRRLIEVLKGLSRKVEAAAAGDLCIYCGRNPVTWPRVCDECQNTVKDEQAELLAYFGEGHDCRTCGMVCDPRWACGYCGDPDPLAKRGR